VVGGRWVGTHGSAGGVLLLQGSGGPLDRMPGGREGQCSVKGRLCGSVDRRPVSLRSGGPEEIQWVHGAQAWWT
jgi:hypothetical protein